MGSTINISTPQPLLGEETFSLAGKTVFDTSTRVGDEITPELSGIYLERFANDTIGIAITASHQERNTGVNAAFVNGWYTRPGDDVLPSGAVDPRLANDANQINRPQTADSSYSLPQSVAYNIAEYNSTRTNAMLNLQWSPMEDFTATVDYIRSELNWSASTATSRHGSQTRLPFRRRVSGPMARSPARFTTQKSSIMLTSQWEPVRTVARILTTRLV